MINIEQPIKKFWQKPSNHTESVLYTTALLCVFYIMRTTGRLRQCQPTEVPVKHFLEISKQEYLSCNQEELEFFFNNSSMNFSTETLEMSYEILKTQFLNRTSQ